jgi:hypothetical protein
VDLLHGDGREPLVAEVDEGRRRIPLAFLTTMLHLDLADTSDTELLQVPSHVSRTLGVTDIADPQGRQVKTCHS